MLKRFAFSIDRFKRANRIEKLYFAKEYFECAAICKESNQSSKGDFFTHYYLGLSNQKLNLIDESIKNLKDALKHIKNNNSQKSIGKYVNYARHEIAMSLRKQRKYQEALDEILSFIIFDPNYTSFYIVKAKIYQDLEKSEEAFDSINEGLRIEPTNTDLLEFKNSLVYFYSVEQVEKRR